MESNPLRRYLTVKVIHKQFLYYLVVGGSTALFEFMMFVFFRKVLFFNLTAANILAIAIATTLNFSLNKTWAFKSAANIYRNILLYMLLFSFNTLFSTKAIHFLVAVGIHDLIAKIFTMGLITAWNFVLYRRFIFR